MRSDDRRSGRGAKRPAEHMKKHSGSRPGKAQGQGRGGAGSRPHRVQNSALPIGQMVMCRFTHFTEHGGYAVVLGPEGPGTEEVLLPRNELPEGAEPEDELELFLYRDSEDRPVATRVRPRILLHEVGRVTVASVTAVGAFLDWGLPKQLLLPYAQQPRGFTPTEGMEILAAAYLDKSGRLCATMNVYPYLSKESPYRAGETVTGTVYETSGNFGVFVAVDDKYSGLIPRREVTESYTVGQEVTLRVTRVKPDGKLDLSAGEKAYLQMGTDAEQLYSELEAAGGFLPYHDKSDPEEIRQRFGMTKNAFKRALGKLLKERRIELTEDGFKQS